MLRRLRQEWDLRGPNRQANTHRLVGWAVVAIGIYLLIAQVRSVVQKSHGLPNIRHSIYWSNSLYHQARRNRSVAISTELAPFYLIERVLEGAELIVGRSLADHLWKLENVGRTRAKVSRDIEVLPPESLKDLAAEASHTSVLGKRMLYVLARQTGVKTYVFFSTTGDTGPVYIVPEPLYRSRAAESRGANLRAP